MQQTQLEVLNFFINLNKISSVNRLIAINHIQNYIICVYCVLYVYKYTHVYEIDVIFIYTYT